MSGFKAPAVLTRVRLRAVDGTDFAFVIDVDPDAAYAEYKRVRPNEDGSHGLMFLPDRRDPHVVWQVWTSSLVGLDATDSDDPIPLPT